MKKSLIALAALAAVSAASAQSTSSLTLGGYFDRGYLATNNTNNLKDAKAVGSNAGTTTVLISGSEDLGGGLKIGFNINTDWSDAAGQTQDAYQVSTSTAVAATTTGTAASIAIPAIAASAGGVVPGTSGFANSQAFLELSSTTMGTLKLGNPNSEVLTVTTAVASPAFSTGVGSVYSTNFSIHNGYGTGTTGSANVFAASSTTSTSGAIYTAVGQRSIRQANTIKYISPTFSGFNLVYATVRKNSTGGLNVAGSTSGTADVPGVTEVGVNYVNGPVAVSYASSKVETGNVTYTNALAVNASTTMKILGASYQVLPQLKLHAGAGRSGSENTTLDYNTQSMQYGATYNLTPAVTLMAQYAKVDDKSTLNVDRKMIGLGADYNFSKTARAYFRYDNINYASNAATSLDGMKQTRTAVGISKAF